MATEGVQNNEGNFDCGRFDLKLTAFFEFPAAKNTAARKRINLCEKTRIRQTGQDKERDKVIKIVGKYLKKEE